MRREGEVVAIYIAGEERGDTISVDEVLAVANVGLQTDEITDRYAKGEGLWDNDAEKSHERRNEVTIQAVEALEAANEEHDTKFEPEDTRRQIFVRGFGEDLRSMIGRNITVGEVEIIGASECTPCNYPSQIAEERGKSGRDNHATAFRENGRGGIRGGIDKTGTIAVGDKITFEAED